MPRLTGLNTLVRALLPTAAFDTVMIALGISDTMDAFTGRNKPKQQ